MPFLRIKEIRDMTSDDSEKKLNELRTELLRLRTMIKAGGTIEHPSRIRELRKAIARILTIEHEKRLGLVRVKEGGRKKK